MSSVVGLLQKRGAGVKGDVNITRDMLCCPGW